MIFRSSNAGSDPVVRWNIEVNRFRFASHLFPVLQHPAMQRAAAHNLLVSIGPYVQHLRFDFASGGPTDETMAYMGQAWSNAPEAERFAGLKFSPAQYIHVSSDTWQGLDVTGRVEASVVSFKSTEWPRLSWPRSSYLPRVHSQRSHQLERLGLGAWGIWLIFWDIGDVGSDLNRFGFYSPTQVPGGWCLKMSVNYKQLFPQYHWRRYRFIAANYLFFSWF